MNIHKNARLTLVRRMEMVRSVVEKRLTLAGAAAEAGVSEPTARKWLGRYLAEGEPGLRDRSSRPNRSPRSIRSEKALAIVELRTRGEVMKLSYGGNGTQTRVLCGVLACENHPGTAADAVPRALAAADRRAGTVARRQIARQCCGAGRHDSEAAFNPAFKRGSGMPPAGWRRHRGEEGGRGSAVAGTGASRV